MNKETDSDSDDNNKETDSDSDDNDFEEEEVVSKKKHELNAAYKKVVLKGIYSFICRND
jgi:hypothetical protein